MLKKVILTIAMILLFVGPSYADDDGFTIWQLTEKRIDADSALLARIGYQMDSIEPFIGTAWIPKQSGETGNIDPPQMVTLGTMIHLPDLIDPNNPLPIIPQALLVFIPKDWIATPYIGWQGTWNFADDDAGYQTGMVGILAKTKPDSRLTFVIEADYNNFFGSVAPLTYDDEWILCLGIRLKW